LAPTAVLVDLDGTVWDSSPWYASVIEGSGSGSVPDALAALAGGRPVATVLRSVGQTRSRFRRSCEARIDRLVLVDDVHLTLDSLAQRGVRLGVVTNLPSWMVEPMLAFTELRSFFSVVVDWGTCPRRKPNPDPILHALEVLGVEPSDRAWYAGDSESDGRAAKEAGIAFAWAAYGTDEDEPDGTDLVLDRFGDLASL
jgi:phosphoglycolate phosphatase